MIPSRADDLGGNIFAPCRTIAEVFLIAHRLYGETALETLLGMLLTEVPRESLREAANDLSRVGLASQAKTIRRYARKARPGPLGFEARWHTQERKRGMMQRLQ